MKALVVVDMLEDFVSGAVANPRAKRIVPNIKRLLERARASEDWLVAFANDAHLPGDFELRVWGEHAMAGQPGAEIIPELAAAPGDFVLPKRTYSSFFETGLDPLLRQFGVDGIILSGQHTNICVRHTTADAFFRGYEVVIPTDGVESLTEEEHTSALKYLQTVYRAELTTTSDLLEKLERAA